MRFFRRRKRTSTLTLAAMPLMGMDGDLVVSGVLELDRVMYYRSLTLLSGSSIVTNGHGVYCELLSFECTHVDPGPRDTGRITRDPN